MVEDYSRSNRIKTVIRYSCLGRRSWPVPANFLFILYYTHCTQIYNCSRVDLVSDLYTDGIHFCLKSSYSLIESQKSVHIQEVWKKFFTLIWEFLFVFLIYSLLGTVNQYFEFWENNDLLESILLDKISFQIWWDSWVVTWDLYRQNL